MEAVERRTESRAYSFVSGFSHMFKIISFLTKTYRSSPDEWEVYHKKFEEWKSNLSPAVKSAIRKAKKKNRRLGQKAPLSSWVQYVLFTETPFSEPFICVFVGLSRRASVQLSSHLRPPML